MPTTSDCFTKSVSDILYTFLKIVTLLVFKSNYAGIEELKARAMELEHRRSFLAMDRRTYPETRMDTYQVHPLEQLQGVGQLCESCWQRIVHTTMQQLYGRCHCAITLTGLPPNNETLAIFLLIK